MFRALALLIGGTLFLTALTTPTIYWIIIQIAGGEAPWPFSRVFDRVAMVWLLIMILILRARFPLTFLKPYFKWDVLKGDIGKILFALFATLSTSLIVIVWCISQGEFVLKDLSYADVQRGILKALPAALLISVLEESFFRILILASLLQRFTFFWSMIICSAFYAVVHFISPARSWEWPGWGLGIGFEYLAAVTERIFLPQVYAALFGLFLVGCVLAICIRRTGSFWLCVGLHAGWVIVLKLTGYFTSLGVNYQELSGVGRRYFFVAQPESWVAVILVLGLVLWRYDKHRALIEPSSGSSK